MRMPDFNQLHFPSLYGHTKWSTEYKPELQTHTLSVNLEISNSLSHKQSRYRREEKIKSGKCRRNADLCVYKKNSKKERKH